MENTTIRLPIPPLFSFEECRWFLDRNYDDCLHTIQPDRLLKTIKLGGQMVLIDISQRHEYLHIDIVQGENSEPTRALVTEYVHEWFDLNRNLAPFYALLARDERAAYMADSYRGLRLIAIPDLFEALCWCIIGQQINLSFAYTLKRRLVERYGAALGMDGTAHHVFPTYETLADLAVEDLQSMQFSRQKATYIIGVARAFAEGAMSRQLLMELPDVESRRQALIGLKGVGIWTANYALMKSLREQSCIPHGDVGLLKALTSHGIIRERNETETIQRYFEQYAGWESYLVLYLWRSLAPQSY
jgi:DNA-3-methyladenine glycosylase II